MRSLLLLALLVPLAGCVGEPGLGSSPTACPASATVETGFLVHFADPIPFEGHCLALSDRGEDIDEDLALRMVNDGPVYLPVDGPGDYYIHMIVEHEDDPYCADHIGVFEEHPGEGLVEVTVENMPVCS